MQELTLEDQTPTREAPSSEAASPRLYTLYEVAGYLGVREDALCALLPDTAIAVDAWPLPGLTRADIGLLERLIRTIRQFYAESAYGGGDL